MVLLQRSTPVWISVDDTYFGQWREATFPWWGSRLKSCAPLKSCNWSLAPLVAESPNPHNTLQLIHHQSQHTRLGSQRLTGSWRLMMQKESPTVQYQWHPVTSSDYLTILSLMDFDVESCLSCLESLILFGFRLHEPEQHGSGGSEFQENCCQHYRPKTKKLFQTEAQPCSSCVSHGSQTVQQPWLSQLGSCLNWGLYSS
jgi:hypothetical protein